MKKILIFITLLLCVNFAQAQNTFKDTVFLEEVVTKFRKKKKLLKYEISGHAAYSGLHHGTSKIVCLLDKLPTGTIKNVTFYLNTGLPNMFKRKLKINYKDVLLGILVCEVDANGKPGKILSENEVKFWVKADHRGSLTVDMSSLNLESTKMFFGFTVLSELSKNENNLYMRFCENESAATYSFGNVFNRNEKNWYLDGKMSFKLKMKIEQ